ncbi:MAG: tetratricopeptide repeat protein [Rhodospirillales bacterium]
MVSSLQLFRQTAPGDWAGPVDQVRVALGSSRAVAGAQQMSRRLPAAMQRRPETPACRRDAKLLADGAKAASAGRSAQGGGLLQPGAAARSPPAGRAASVRAHRPQSGDHAGALAMVRQALAVDARQAPFHNSEGVILLALDRLAEAEQCFRRALDRDPLYAEALNNLGNALQRRHLLADAVAAYGRAIEARPGYAEAWCNRGRTLHLDGRTEDAVASLRQALGLRPGWAKALRWLGNALGAAGDRDAAEAAYRQALEVDACDAETCGAGGTAGRGNRLEDALAAADAALRNNPSLLRAAVTAAGAAPAQRSADSAGELDAVPAIRRGRARCAAFERGQILDRTKAYAAAYQAFVEGNLLLAEEPAARRIDRAFFPRLIERLRQRFTAEWVAGWQPAPSAEAGQRRCSW